MCFFFGFVDSCNDNGLVMFLCGTVVLVVMMMGTEIALRRGAQINQQKKQRNLVPLSLPVIIVVVFVVQPTVYLDAVKLWCCYGTIYGALVVENRQIQYFYVFFFVACINSVTQVLLLLNLQLATPYNTMKKNTVVQQQQYMIVDALLCILVKENGGR